MVAAVYVDDAELPHRQLRKGGNGHREFGRRGEPKGVHLAEYLDKLTYRAWDAALSTSVGDSEAVPFSTWA